MQTVKVRASTEYDVLIERGILKKAGELIKEYTGAGRALLITDHTVDGLYSKAALESLKSAGINCEKFVFEDGEEHKSLKTVGDILSFAAQLSLKVGGIDVQRGADEKHQVDGSGCARIHFQHQSQPQDQQGTAADTQSGQYSQQKSCHESKGKAF